MKEFLILFFGFILGFLTGFIICAMIVASRDN